jgi:hypothetical protein
MKALAMFLAVVTLSTRAHAQTTITSSDVSSILAVGNLIVNHADTLTTTVNIGTPGSTANNWDFSTLATHRLDTMQSVSPSGTPYISWFPGATHTLKSRATLEGVTGTLYVYLALGTNLLNPGIAGDGPTPFGTAVLRETKTPSQIYYKLPMTLGTAWTSTFVDSFVATIGGFPAVQEVTNHTVTNTVDAYGTMTLPGNFGSHAALRLRIDDTFSGAGGSGRTISYQFLSGDGSTVQFVAADTLQPDNGVINIDRNSTAWSGQMATSVRLSKELPKEFVLMQNYPNPFNPATVIRYSLPVQSYVSLKVYDVLGREIATLVSEVLPAGTYEQRWNAAGVSSGVYFYRLKAGGFVETKKLVLLR